MSDAIQSSKNRKNKISVNEIFINKLSVKINIKALPHIFLFIFSNMYSCKYKYKHVNMYSYIQLQLVDTGNS